MAICSVAPLFEFSCLSRLQVDAFDIPDRILNSALGSDTSHQLYECDCSYGNLRRSADGNVYERLFVSAKKSQLNQIVPFQVIVLPLSETFSLCVFSHTLVSLLQGYTEHLRPHLDLKFLALR